MSLTQLLLWFQTPNPDGSKKTILWGGEEREILVPKGLLIMSGWVDLARCFPSEVDCAGGDYCKSVCSNPFHLGVWRRVGCFCFFYNESL